jgi:hypothetical protein
MKDQGPKTDERKNSADRQTKRTQLFVVSIVLHRFTPNDFVPYRAKPLSTQRRV